MARSKASTLNRTVAQSPQVNKDIFITKTFQGLGDYFSGMKDRLYLSFGSSSDFIAKSIQQLVESLDT